MSKAKAVMTTSQTEALVSRGYDRANLISQNYSVFGEGVEHLHGRDFSVPPSLLGSPDYVPVKYHYFERDFFTYMWHFAMNCNNSISFIFGPSGTGKTSGPIQFFARLNWPTVVFNASKRKELIDLEGMWLPSESGMEYFEGCLIDCMKNGKVLIINEISLMDPGEIAGLNDIKPNSTFTLAGKGGEKIHVHPNFRLVVTDNTNGTGDRTGSFTGTGRLNAAFLDRCRGYEKMYLPADEEIKVLENELEAILATLNILGSSAEKPIREAAEMLLPALISFANDTRLECKNANLGFPLTTRTLMDMLMVFICYSAKGNALKKALEQCYLWSLREQHRALVENMFQLRFKNAA